MNGYKYFTNALAFFILVPLLAMANIIHLYTQKQLDSYLRVLVDSSAYAIEYNQGEITLCNFLYDNFHTLRKWDKTEAGWTGNYSEYSNWKSKLINNSEIGSLAIKEIGPFLIRQLNTQLKYRDQTSEFTFDEDGFWNTQRIQIDRYQRLIMKLMELPDSELNYFFFTNKTPASSYEFNLYLETEGLIDQANDCPSIQWDDYPGDLIQLVKRTAENNENWTYRSCLETANTFAEELSDIIP